MYDARKRKPGLKTGAVEGLSRRVGTQAMCSRLNFYHLSTYAETLIEGTAEALEDAFHSTQGLGSGASTATETNGASPAIANLAGSINTLATTIEKLTAKIDSLENVAAKDNIATASPTSRTRTTAETEDGESSSRMKRRRTETHYDRSTFTPASFTNTFGPTTRGGYTKLPDELLDDVVHLYFMRIHHWIPILHWTRFKHQYSHNALRGKMGVILNALVAGTLKYVNREQYHVSDGDVEKISSECRELVLLTAMNSLCVENLQALIIIAFLDVSCFQSRHSAYLFDHHCADCLFPKI